MRPNSLSEFIGNEAAIEQVKTQIEIVQKLKKPFPHSLVTGPPGEGKTLLSELIAKEIGAKHVYVNATAISDPHSFRELLRNAVPHELSLITLDEAHALPKLVRLNMLSLLEQPSILCTPGKIDHLTKRIKKSLGYITKEKLPDGASIILTTTHAGNLEDAIIDRCFRIHLFEYSVTEKSTIAKNILNKMDVPFTEDAINIIGERCRNARHVAQICERSIEKWKISTFNILDDDVIKNIFKVFEIDDLGLSEIERRIIQYLSRVGRASLDSISGYMNMSQREVREKIEPRLIRMEFIVRVQGGRILTDKAREVFNLAENDSPLRISDL